MYVHNVEQNYATLTFLIVKHLYKDHAKVTKIYSVFAAFDCAIGLKTRISNETRCIHLISSRGFGALEQVKKRTSKVAIHETVRDRIGTCRRECKQLQHRDPLIPESDVHKFGLVKGNSVDYVQRRPANEKFEYDDKEHLNDALLLCSSLCLLIASKRN